MAPTSTKRQRTEVRSLTNLPFEFICLIMAKVGAKSFKELLKIKSCWKVMEKAGESHLVYRELNIFAVLKLPITLQIVDDTLKKCEEHVNLLHLFRAGVFKFLGSGDNTKLMLAGEKGQRHAIFMNSMLMIAKDWENKEQALRMLNSTFRGSGRGEEVKSILWVISGLCHGRKLKHNGIWWTCPAHGGINHRLAGYNQWQWFVDCNVCFWEYCFAQFVSIFVAV